MGSRRKTGVEDVRLPELSRRAVIAGTSVAVFRTARPAAASATAPVVALSVPDEGTKRCARWLAINAKIERLQTRWGKLESWLAREHSWFQLSPAEQKALPWAKELHDIDGRLGVLFEQRNAVLESLPTCDSASMESVIARLAVAERLIWPCDDPEAHALIAGARRDLIAISRGHSHSSLIGAGTHVSEGV